MRANFSSAEGGEGGEGEVQVRWGTSFDVLSPDGALAGGVPLKPVASKEGPAVRPKLSANRLLSRAYIQNVRTYRPTLIKSLPPLPLLPVRNDDALALTTRVSAQKVRLTNKHINELTGITPGSHPDFKAFSCEQVKFPRFLVQETLALIDTVLGAEAANAFKGTIFTDGVPGQDTRALDLSHLEANFPTEAIEAKRLTLESINKMSDYFIRPSKRIERLSWLSAVLALPAFHVQLLTVSPPAALLPALEPNEPHGSTPIKASAVDCSSVVTLPRLRSGRASGAYDSYTPVTSVSRRGGP